MRARPSLTRLTLFFAAIAILGSATSAQTDEPLGPDRIALRFRDAKLAKTFQLETTLQNTKFSEGVQYGPHDFAAQLESSNADAFGIIETPIVSSGPYSVDLTLGFAGLEGIASGALDGGASQAGIEVDLLGSNPLLFYFLGIYWAQNQLWAYASGSSGQVGQPLALGPTLWAVLRVVQTANAIEFYARAYKAASFALVASLAVAPWNGLARFAFGASNLGRGARVLFAAFLASGVLFDPVTLPYILSLANSIYPDFAEIHCALIFEPNPALAFATLGALLPLIESTRAGIENDGRADLFLGFVLWQSAAKFLASAHSSGTKAHIALSRNDFFKALPSLFLMSAYLQLADLSLRGMAVKKAEELRYFKYYGGAA